MNGQIEMDTIRYVDILTDSQTDRDRQKGRQKKRLTI